MNIRYFGFVLTVCSLVATASAQSPDATDSRKALAQVGGHAIYEDDLLVAVQGQLQPLRTQEYEIKRKGLETLIEQKLLENAAKEKGITTDKLLDEEVKAKVPEPSESEIEGFYLAERDRLNRPLDDALKAQLRLAIKQAKTGQMLEEYVKRLRADGKVAVLLSPPRVEVAYDPKRLRGNPKAPVMIVEFSDYECPYCHQAEPTVKNLLVRYGDKVSFSYRDFPLTSIHGQAMIAAEASRCAEEQGKFWEYHDQLFTATKLDKDVLVEYARGLKLDAKQFDSCLTSEKYKAEIEEDGRRAGVNGTPGFFINGIEVSGAKPGDTFAQIIDGELAKENSLPTATLRTSRMGR